MRPITRIKRTPRTAELNEAYYRRFNHPSFNHFGPVHFVDAAGREYKLAAQNDDTYQNEMLRRRPDVPRCIVDANGYVRLYVKLAQRGSEWFSPLAVNRPLTLRDPRRDLTYAVVLRSAFRYSARRRTGVITLSGLAPHFCNQLLAHE